MSRETRLAIEQSRPMPQCSESRASVRYETNVFSHRDRQMVAEFRKEQRIVTQTSWASEVLAVNRTGSYEIEDATLASSNELCANELPRIVGNSAALRRVLGLVRVVAPTDATVLI